MIWFIANEIANFYSGTWGKDCGLALSMSCIFVRIDYEFMAHLADLPDSSACFFFFSFW